MNVTIQVKYTEVLAKIKRHLSTVGKRAKTIDGKTMYSDFQTTVVEDPIFNDLIDSGAETLVSNLGQLCSAYLPLYSSGEPPVLIGTSIIFSNLRWSDDNSGALTGALKEACANYLYNFALAQYLSLIHPGTGEKYPPRWGTPYQEQCSIILGNIQRLALIKENIRSQRPAIPYTSFIRMSGTTVDIELGEEASITYIIETGTINDVDVVVDGDCVDVIHKNGQFYLRGVRPGVTVAKLFSVHDESVFVPFQIFVLNPDGSYPEV